MEAQVSTCIGDLTLKVDIIGNVDSVMDGIAMGNFVDGFGYVHLGTYAIP